MLQTSQTLKQPRVQASGPRHQPIVLHPPKSTLCSINHGRRKCVMVAANQQQIPRPTNTPGRTVDPNRGPYAPPPIPPQGYNPQQQIPPYQGQPQQPQQPFVVSQQQPQQERKLGSYASALVAAAFIAGLGIGVYFDSEVTLSPYNVSSTEIIDRSTPNADVCMANGYSASVFDMKLYVTFNPFNVYTTQPVIKSGCVLRRANVGVLEREKLVTQHEVDICKSRMNTFAYMGDLKNSPEVACVYHSEEAENQYLDNLRKRGGMGAMMANTAAGESISPEALAASLAQQQK